MALVAGDAAIRREQYVLVLNVLAWNNAVRLQTAEAGVRAIPPRPERSSRPLAAPVLASAPVSSGACGGDLPSCCTLEHESHGNPYAVEPGHAGAPSGDPGDPEHHASGLWQFMPRTWNGFDGYPYAAAAPAAVQNEKARQVFAGGAGASNWYGDGCYNGR